jgi:hypothetical protein
MVQRNPEAKGVDEVERKRRHGLLAAHLAAENRGDIAAIMSTFSADAVMSYNATPFPNPERSRRLTCTSASRRPKARSRTLAT